MATRGLWAAVATRYDAEVELRTEPLGARFWCRFEDGVLVVRKSNGVERRIDRDELRAALRMLESNVQPEAVRMVTAHGQYIRAIGDDLGAQGHDPGDLDDDDYEEEGTIETILIEEAYARTRAADDLTADGPEPSPAGTDAGGDDRAEILRDLSEARAASEELVREYSRSRARVAEAEQEIGELRERTAELERALAAARKSRAAATPGQTSRPDWAVLPKLALGELAGVTDVDYRRPIEEIASSTTAAAKHVAVNCRQLLERVALDEYVRTFNTTPIPGAGRHGDLMAALRGQPRVDEDLWFVRKSLYSYLSGIIHGRRNVDSRMAGLLILVTATVIREVVSATPR